MKVEKEEEDIVKMLNSMKEDDVQGILRKSIELMKHRSRSTSPTPDFDNHRPSALQNLQMLFEQASSLGIESIEEALFSDSFKDENGKVKKSSFVNALLEDPSLSLTRGEVSSIITILQTEPSDYININEI